MATAKTLGFVCALVGLTGCMGTRSGPPAHATTAAAVAAIDEESSDARTVVRLRESAQSGPLPRQALAAARRALADEGFVVTSDPDADADVDIVLRANGAGASRTEVTLDARVGARAMVPISVYLTGDGDEKDEARVEDLCTRWQRRFHRSPRLARHFVEVGP